MTACRVGARRHDAAPARARRAASSGWTDVHTYYGHIHALQGVDLEVRRGEIVTLSAPTARARRRPSRRSAGLLHPRAGTVEFEGKDISKTRRPRARRAGIGQPPRAAGSSRG